MLSKIVHLCAALLLSVLASSNAFVIPTRIHAMSALTATGLNAARKSSRMAPLAMSSGDDSRDVRTGIVKWFNTIKGFGFIQPDDGGQDVFVHQTSIKSDGFRSLADGERVEFRSEPDERGRLRALQVTGPDGIDVQGAPFRPSKNEYERY